MSRESKIQVMMSKKKRRSLTHISIALALVALVVFSNLAKELRNRRNEMIDVREPIIVGFPLRGEWYSPNTPGTKIPSHGTNQLGTRYAYDFIQVDTERKGWPAYRGSLAQYLLFGVPLADYYCWGQDVYAPCDGIVVQAEDGYEERERTNLISDMSNAYNNAHYFDPKIDDVQSVAGNYIIMECGKNVYAALVHLQTGSIQVSVGQSVKKGEVIGRVGHSGNSFAPSFMCETRTFSYIAEIPLSEYIRRRRLTLAAFELQNTDSKIIDIALKYGYEAPESFSRAFKNMHGISPTMARNKS